MYRMTYIRRTSGVTTDILGMGWRVERRQLYRACLERLNRSLQDEEEGKEHSGKMETLKKKRSVEELT